MSTPRSKQVVHLAASISEMRRTLRRLGSAALASILFHAVTIGALLLLLRDNRVSAQLDDAAAVVEVNALPADEEPKETFLSDAIDPLALMPEVDPGANNPVKGSVNLPGEPDLREKAGFERGAADARPVDMPLPYGFGPGQGAPREGLGGAQDRPGTSGGENHGMVLPPGGILGRGGQAKQWALTYGGGNKDSEAAVAAGLKWLARHQLADGRWMLDDPRNPDRGSANDTAATAFGLLPFLGAGMTHKSSKTNSYDKQVDKGLAYLLRKQDKRTGNLGGGMYAHGLATIALCEAYCLSKDPNLRRPAQLAVNYIVEAQHPGGGWRYAPGQAGDTSVTGWQIMALKSAQMADLSVPEIAMRKAQKYLDACCAADEGYGYAGPGSTPAMSAVGLLCRQYLQSWGPQNLRMIKGVDNHIRKNPGNVKNMYYTYYAAQVMHHFGGQAWKEWNEGMRGSLIKAQDQGNGPLAGSWSSQGDPHGGAGGRLMQTSLSLLTLEVYYRYLPLYVREADMKKVAIQK